MWLTDKKSVENSFFHGFLFHVVIVCLGAFYKYPVHIHKSCRQQVLIRQYCAARTRLELFEEVVALVIHEDECREVLHVDLPDGLHAQFRILNALDALDARL